MKIEEIEKSINTKYKKLLSEIERKNKFTHAALIFLFSCSIVAMLFFVLPRYQTIMKIALIPFAAFGIHRLIVVYLNRFYRSNTPDK